MFYKIVGRPTPIHQVKRAVVSKPEAPCLQYAGREQLDLSVNGQAALKARSRAVGEGVNRSRAIARRTGEATITVVIKGTWGISPYLLPLPFQI